MRVRLGDMSADESDTRAAYVIVGGGLAAARAVEGIRESDSTGRIVVVAEEDRLPYERPPLSKAVLIGTEPEDVAYPHPREWYDEQGVELRLGVAATGLDVDAKTVTLADGGTLAWDKLLLATGSTVRRLDVPGADLMDVLYLRSMTDSAAIKARLVAGSEVVIVGGGWIGLEVAAAARTHGCEVTLVEPQDAPLSGVVGPEVGAWFAGLHRAHGVDVRLGTGVESFTGENGQVTGVVTTDGATLAADTVVVGIGITPNTGLAESAGIGIEQGVTTDRSLRTDAVDVWAAGDVASWDSALLGTHVRVDHWANANDAGLAAGRSMAGVDVTYDPVPFFFSDQYDVGLEYTGYVPRGTDAEVVFRGDREGNEFMVFWVVPAEAETDGERVRVLAAMHVNQWDSLGPVEPLIRNRTGVTREQLSDPSQALDALA